MISRATSTCVAGRLEALGFALGLSEAAQEPLTKEQERERVDRRASRRPRSSASGSRRRPRRWSEWATETIQADDALADLAAGVRADVDPWRRAVVRVRPEQRAARLAGHVRDIDIAINDLSARQLEGIKVSDVLSGDIKADEFSTRIDDLRPEIQTKITEAFAAGGVEAATEMAKDYIDQVDQRARGSATLGAVAKMLGLENIEATVGVALELSEVEKARRQLEVLVGVGGETPLTASIALALDAGTITAEQAEALVQPMLEDAGITVPNELEVPHRSRCRRRRRGRAARPGSRSRSARRWSHRPVRISSTSSTPDWPGSASTRSCCRWYRPPRPRRNRSSTPRWPGSDLNPITAPLTGPLPTDLQAAIDTVIAGVVPPGFVYVPLAPLPPSGTDILNLVNAGLTTLRFDPIQLDVAAPSPEEATLLVNAELLKMGLKPITIPLNAPLSAD